MKKIIFLTVFAYLLMMLTSCDPEPIPPGPPPVFYTLSTIVSGKGSVNPDKLSGIIPGSNITVKFIPETGYSLYSVKVNEVKIDIQPTATEVPYTIMGINKDPVVEVEFVETDVLIFSVKSINEKPWMLIEVGVYKAEGDVFLRNWILTQAEKSDRYYFLYPSMDGFVYQENGGIRTGKWSLKQKVLQLGSEVLDVVELSSTKIVYRAKPIWSNTDNCYVYAMYILERK